MAKPSSSAYPDHLFSQYTYMYVIIRVRCYLTTLMIPMSIRHNTTMIIIGHNSCDIEYFTCYMVIRQGITHVKNNLVSVMVVVSGRSLTKLSQLQHRFPALMLVLHKLVLLFFKSFLNTVPPMVDRTLSHSHCLQIINIIRIISGD